MGKAENEKRRRALPTALVIVATVLLFVSVFAIWAKRQLLETDTWVDTSTELLASAPIREQLSNFLVDELYANVDVESEISSRLPPRFAQLAGPISSGLESALRDVAARVLESSQAQDLWEQANRTVHEQFLAVIENRSEDVTTSDGSVVLDLRGILDQLTADIGFGQKLVAKIPPDAAQLRILAADQLEAAQTGVRLLRAAAYVISAITIALYALAIFLARGRRRETLRAAGIGLAVVGVLVLFLRNRAGDLLTESLASTTSAEPAVDATWLIGTSQLKEIGQSLAIYGVLIFLAAWLAGPTRWARWIRARIAPYWQRPEIAFGVAAVLLLLFFWWGPTEATHRLAPSLLLIVLVALGTEALRRQIAREFPGARGGAT
jgi:hypothetical protein